MVAPSSLNSRKRSRDEEKDNSSPDPTESCLTFVNILNSSPAHVLITACRFKYFYSQDSNKWKKIASKAIVDASNELDPDLRKTFPLFYCIAVGQRQYNCLRLKTRSFDYLQYRDANVKLVSILRSSPPEYFGDMCEFLKESPTEEAYRAMNQLDEVMEFIDRFDLTTRFSGPYPCSRDDESTLINSLQTYLTITVHDSPKCKSLKTISVFHTFCHQKCKPRTSASTCSTSGSSSSSSLNDSVPPITSFEHNLRTYINACYALTGNHNDFTHLISTPSDFQRCYQAFIQHNGIHDILLSYAAIIFHQSEISRKGPFCHAHVQGQYVHFLGQLTRSFCSAVATLDERMSGNALAYYLDPKCMHRLIPSGSLAEPTMVRELYHPSPSCWAYNPASDCKQTLRAQGASYRYNTVPSVPTRRYSAAHTKPKRARQQDDSSASSVTSSSTPPPSPQTVLAETKQNSTTTSNLNFDSPIPPLQLRRSPRLHPRRETLVTAIPEYSGLDLLSTAYPSSTDTDDTTVIRAPYPLSPFVTSLFDCNCDLPDYNDFKLD